MPADAELEDRGDRRASLDAAGVCDVNPGKKFQERALAAAVGAHEANGLATLDAERHRLQNAQLANRPGPECRKDMFADGIAVLLRNPEGLRDVLQLDHAHTNSAARGPYRR